MPVKNWVQLAKAQIVVPKESLIGVLKKNMGGAREGRDRSIVHASDITKASFCPRQWALNDLQQIKSKPEYLSTTQQATFDVGRATAKLLVEEWAGDSVVGNWKCLRCEQTRTLCSKPLGICPDAKGKDRSHLWEYKEVCFESQSSNISGSIDSLFQFGTPYLRVTELKILSVDDFEKILAPMAEHRIRTSLYLHIVDESNSPYKSRFNLLEGTVFYVSRGYGKKNDLWNGEVLPFKEFVVKRDEEIIKEPIQKAKALKIFREEGKMPTGICNTANDNFAKKCDACKICFSGDYPAQVNWSFL